MTIIPNFFVTGVLAIIVSLIVILWAAAIVQRKYCGLFLILLSIIHVSWLVNLPKRDDMRQSFLNRANPKPVLIQSGNKSAARMPSFLG